MYKTLKIILLAIFSIASYASQANEPTHNVPSSISPVINKSMPAVVNLEVYGEIPIYKDDSQDSHPRDSITQKYKGFGSGVLVDSKKAYVLTNAHIVKHAKKIIVTLFDGTKTTGKVIGLDSATDIAVLEIPPQDVKPIEFGNSDNLNIGDFVAAIGNPFHLNLANGSNQTVTFGIISALNRSEISSGGYYDFIQSDAAVNPGNSGGALINMHGQLIGITTALLAPSNMAVGNIGVSFAIPINMAKSIMEQIIKYGSVKRAALGTIVQNFSPELAPAFNTKITKGAIVTQVNPLSPAKRSGIQPGDIITKIDNDIIADASQVRNIISLKRIGSIINIEIIRNGKVIQIKATIDEIKDNSYDFLSGVQMQSITEQSPVHGLIKGVQIHGLLEMTPAHSAGLQPGDIIVAANHVPIADIDALKQVVKNASKDILLRVIRGQTSFFALLKKEQEVSTKQD